MSLKDFHILAKLGEGAYSKVYKVQRISDNQIYALKRVKIANLSEKEKENALNEVRILASIQSNYIIGYKEVFFDDNSMALYIVMEYAENGDLFAKLGQHQKNKTYMKEQDIWSHAIQMLIGLKSLHDMKILHRDLKSANVFILKNDHVKLGDLNVSKIMKEELVYTQTGTPYYASPEVWRDQPYNTKSDIWSLGCVVYEMCAMKTPFRGKDMEAVYQKVKKGIFDPIPSVYSSELEHFISMCLQVSASARPSCDQLLNTPLVQKKGLELLKDLNDASPRLPELLETIRIPKNIRWLSKQLPKPKYTRGPLPAVNLSADYHPRSPSHEREGRNGMVKRAVSQNNSLTLEQLQQNIEKSASKESKAFQSVLENLHENDKESLKLMEKDSSSHPRGLNLRHHDKLPEIKQRPKALQQKLMNLGNIVHGYDANYKPLYGEIGYLAPQLESRINNNHRVKLLSRKVLNTKRSTNDIGLHVKSGNSSMDEEPREKVYESSVIRKKVLESFADEPSSLGSAKHISESHILKMNHGGKLRSQKNLSKIPSESNDILQRKVDRLLKKYQTIEHNSSSQRDLAASEVYRQDPGSDSESIVRDFRKSSKILGYENDSASNLYRRPNNILKRKGERYNSTGKTREVPFAPYKVSSLNKQFEFLSVEESKGENEV